uniref:MKRN2 opposite strand, tandem duplicate 2 n=1 Tax=Stegastes partitus TaxID=144197 RepID=A0A3B5BF00_9TELE
MERSVIRLSHCQKEIFCFSLPDECPSCGEELRGSRLQEAPVSLPSPFTDGHKSSCCLLVAPAHDNLHRDFDGTSDLHTGISNTKGTTHLVFWCSSGQRQAKQTGTDRFHEDDHNCFSFCLQFVNSVLTAEGRSPLSRDEFTHSFILPRMRRVSKYTTLYQHIQRHQYYMVDRQQEERRERADGSSRTHIL